MIWNEILRINNCFFYLFFLHSSAKGYHKMWKIVLVIFNQIYFSDFLNLQPKWHYGGTRKAEILR